MIKVEQWTTIRTLYSEGYGKKRIAKMLRISVNTVRRALKDDTPPSYRRTKTGDRKILPYLEKIREMYLEKKLIGTRIFEELKKQGYDGSLMTLYRCLRTLKEEQGNKACLRFETLPGEQAQFDWSPFDVEIAGEKVRVYCYLVILGYSRMKYMTFSLKQDLFAVIEALEEAFCFFGGSTKEVVMDNAGQMVFEIRNGVKCFNETFLALAGLYRFRPIAHRVRHPQTKGKVERPFYYIEEHFIKGNSFDSLEDLINKGHAFIREWCVKEHKTTLKKPEELFWEEKELLQPLPQSLFIQSLRKSRKVSRDCLVSVGGSRYSVPAQHAGTRVWVLVRHGYLLEVQDQAGTMITAHELSKTKGSTNIKEEHYQELRKTPCTAPRIREIFMQTFPSGKDYYRLLLEKVGYNAAYHAQRILDLKAYYPDEAIEQALRHALRYRAASYKTVTNILRSLVFWNSTPSAGTPAPFPVTGQMVRPLACYRVLLQ